MHRALLSRSSPLTGQLDFQLPQNPLAYAPPRSCSQGSISTYYVDAHTCRSRMSGRMLTSADQDVQAALAFATQNNVPISVKNSGPLDHAT